LFQRVQRQYYESSKANDRQHIGNHNAPFKLAVVSFEKSDSHVWLSVAISELSQSCAKQDDTKREDCDAQWRIVRCIVEIRLNAEGDQQQ
jgi:hypothetical protein